MDHQPDLFDADESERRKDVGMLQATDNRRGRLAPVRRRAVRARPLERRLPTRGAKASSG